METSKINRKRNYYNYGQVTGDFLNFYAWQWNFWAFILFPNWNCRWQWIVSSPHRKWYIVQRNSKRSISCEQIWTNCSVQCYHAGYRFPWWPQLDNLPCSQWYCGRNVDNGQSGERLTTSCVFHTAGRLIPNSDVGLFRHSYLISSNILFSFLVRYYEYGYPIGFSEIKMFRFNAFDSLER